MAKVVGKLLIKALEGVTNIVELVSDNVVDELAVLFNNKVEALLISDDTVEMVLDSMVDCNALVSVDDSVLVIKELLTNNEFEIVVLST